MTRKLFSYYYKSSVVKIILIGIFLPLIFSFLLGFAINLFSTETEPSLDFIERIKKYTNVFFILLAIVIAPLFETLIFHYLPVKICQIVSHKRKYRNCCIVIILSSILFAFLHITSIHHFFVSLIGGFVLAFSCFVLIRRKQRPLLYTAIIHAGYNGILMFAGIILKLAGIPLTT